MIWQKNYKQLFVFTLGLAFIQFLSSCVGCSPSARRSKQDKSPYGVERPLPARPARAHSHSTTQHPTHQINEGMAHATAGQPQALSELYETYKSSVFLIYTSNGDYHRQGSGFFVSKDGLGVSNYHVFEGTNIGYELVSTFDGQQFKINEILAKDKEMDYIIFRVAIGHYQIPHPLPITKRNIRVGEDVFAIGNPKGLESTLSKGIVSSLRENEALIQTTAEITHGSSGGPLINMQGEVIGITTAGLGEANLNFAINIKFLQLHNYL